MHLTGRLVEGLGYDELAGSMFEIALKSAPGDEVYRRTASEFYAQHGRAEHAELLLADDAGQTSRELELTDLAPAAVGLLLVAANLFTEQGELDAAADILRQADDGWSDDPGVQRALADVLQMRDESQAIRPAEPPKPPL